MNQKKLLIGNGYALYIGALFDNKMHNHHAIQIVVSPNEFQIDLPSCKIKCSGLIVKSEVKHRLHLGFNYIIILIEPETLFGTYLQNRIKNDFLLYSENEIAALNGTINNFDSFSIQKLFKLNNYERHLVVSIDTRVQFVLKYLSEPGNYSQSLQEVVKLVNLSQSRIEHLFKKEVGISMKQYLLWQKMITSIKLAKNHRTLTDVAYQCGFSDSAHLSRCFTSMFGVKMKGIIKNSNSIQVIFK